jgi:hypothetical protein
MKSKILADYCNDWASSPYSTPQTDIRYEWKKAKSELADAFTGLLGRLKEVEDSNDTFQEVKHWQLVVGVLHKNDYGSGLHVVIKDERYTPDTTTHYDCSIPDLRHVTQQLNSLTKEELNKRLDDELRKQAYPN